MLQRAFPDLASRQSKATVFVSRFSLVIKSLSLQMTGELEPGPESLADHKRVFSPSSVGILADETPVPFSPRKRGHVSCADEERIKITKKIQGFMGEVERIIGLVFRQRGWEILCFSMIAHNFQVFFFGVYRVLERV